MDLRRLYTWEMPAKLVFGPGAARKAGEELKALGATATLLVTDKGVRNAGLTKGIEESLVAAGITYHVFDEVEPNPSIACVHKSLAMYREHGCNTLLAVGGGSSMDTAKATGILVTNPGPISAYEGMNKYQNPLPPLVAVPTTCGTGAEVTYFAVVTDTERQFKMGIGSVLSVPKVALLDAELLTNMPGHIVAATGMDALTHAVESYTNLNAQPVSDALDLMAIRMISENLRPAVANANLEVMSNMVVASALAGMGFTNTRLTLVHAMSHTLGGRAGVPHGVANAILLPHVMEWNLIGNAERFADVAEALGVDTTGLSVMEAAELAPEAVRALMADIGIPMTMSEVGVKAEMIEDLADDSLLSGNVPLNPRRATRADVVALLQRAL